MARLGARIRKGTMETMKTLGTAAVARSPMTPVTNVDKTFSVPGMLQSPTVGQGLTTTNGNMVRLGDVATYINGYAFKPADWSTEGVLIIRIQDLTGNSYKANRFKGKIDKRYEVLNGDVLISWSASLGVYVWSGEKAVLNQHIFKVQFDKRQVDKSFFVHQVECILKRAIGEAHGATMKHLTKPAFDALPFYLPDIQKQKSIADSLDKISHLITLRKRQLSKLDELVKSQFVEMFGDEKRFPSVMVGDVFTVKGPKRIHKEEWTSEGVPFYRVSNLSDLLEGRKTISDNFISRSRFEELKADEQVPKAGDVLVTARGTLGRCYVVKPDDEFYFQDGMITWLTDRSESITLPYFLQAVQSQTFKRQYEGKSSGTTVAYMTIGQLAKYRLPLPPLALQRKFAAFVEKVDKLAFKAKASLEKLETLKKAMMQKYFN